MLVGEVVTGLLIDGTAALVTLIGEGTRLLVMAGLLWAGGDLALLLIDAGHDLRVARILLGRINAQMHVDGAAEPGAARARRPPGPPLAARRPEAAGAPPGGVQRIGRHHPGPLDLLEQDLRDAIAGRRCDTVSAPWFTSTTRISPR